MQIILNYHSLCIIAFINSNKIVGKNVISNTNFIKKINKKLSHGQLIISISIKQASATQNIII
jgi:hypothetical protein